MVIYVRVYFECVRFHVSLTSAKGPGINVDHGCLALPPALSDSLTISSNSGS